MKTVTLSDAVADVLRQSTVTDGVVRLPDVTLDQKLYRDVNKALEAIGGTWNRKAKGHTFSGAHDVIAEKFDELLERGAYAPPNKHGYFPTPPTLVARLIELAQIGADHWVLEPSAGQGAIADGIRPLVRPENLYLCENLPANCAVLKEKGYWLLGETDFLSYIPVDSFDRVVMNPPFERQQDIDHVLQAWKHLRPGGRLVSVMAAGVTFREDRKAREFRDLIASVDSYVEANPPGSFRESGTDVSTVTVVLNKPADGAS